MGSVEQIAAGPREYRLRAAQKAAHLFFAAMSWVMAAIFLVQSAGDLHPAAPMVFSAALTAFGLYMAMAALRSRLAIDGTRMRLQGALRVREFDLGQVEGYRTYQGRYGSSRVICLKDRAGRFAVTSYATDARFEEWFGKLKDLDEQDEEQLLEKIDQDAELGATQEERRSALERAKRVAIAVLAVDAGSAAAFVWGPADYRLAAMTVLALAPVAASCLLYRRPLLYGAFKARGDPRGDVSPVPMISGFGLLMGAMRVTFVSMDLLFPFIAFGVLASLAMFYPAARRGPRFAATLMGLCFLSALYGWGLALSVDTAADRSAPQTYTAQVLGEHISRGSRSTSYYLILEPWGPYEAGNTAMKVSGAMYAATRPGDIVCLALHAGALHAPWYEPVTCGRGTE